MDSELVTTEDLMGKLKGLDIGFAEKECGPVTFARDDTEPVFPESSHVECATGQDLCTIITLAFALKRGKVAFWIFIRI